MESGKLLPKKAPEKPPKKTKNTQSSQSPNQEAPTKHKLAIIIVPAIGASNIISSGSSDIKQNQGKFKNFFTQLKPTGPKKGFAANEKMTMLWHHVLSSAETVREMLLSSSDWEPIPLGNTPQEQRGWGQVVQDVYLPFMDDCQKKTNLPFIPEVFAIGYNFTQSNKFSAQTVIERTKDIMTQNKDCKEFIYVTHSMGTFPARYALKLMSQNFKPIYEKCIGVIHVAPPNLGSAETYKRFLSGVDSDSLLTSHVLGRTGEKFSIPACVMPSIFELLPIPKERSKTFIVDTQFPEDLPIRGKKEKFPPPTNTSQDHFPPKFPSLIGVIQQVLKSFEYLQDNVKAMKQNLINADDFHNNLLGDFTHPNTAALTLTGTPTVGKINFTQNNSSILDVNKDFLVLMNDGDGTVTVESQSAYVTNPYFIESVKGIEHSKPLSEDGRQEVFPKIYELMDILWKIYSKSSVAQSLATSTVFPRLESGFNYAFSDQPILLNGMKVIFDQPVGVYPVNLESKEEARRNGT